ncbi:AI-2E family transporter [Candidatus Saccharibacteria bacterium]|nr:AI-2E family transporter [Candidatus Saccharibacteria bacterium]
MSKTVQVDTKTFVRFWLVVAVLAIAAFLISQASTGILIVGIAIFFAIAVRPLVYKVEKLIGKDRHALASGLTVGGLVLVIGLALAVVGPTVVTETTNFLRDAPTMIQNDNGSWEKINDFGKFFGIEDAHAQIVSGIKDLSGQLLNGFKANFLSSVGAVGSFLAGLVLTIIIAILWLIQGPEIMDKFWHKVTRKNSEVGKLSRRIVSNMSNVISKYVGGQALVALLDGTVTGLIVFILSLIFGFSSGLAFPMALIAAIFYLIPMFGPLITAVVVSLITFISAPLAGLIFLVVYVIYEQIENNIIAPKVQGNALDLPSVIILISVTIGIYMFGLIGAIISIPIAGMIKILIDEYPNIRALHDKD